MFVHVEVTRETTRLRARTCTRLVSEVVVHLHFEQGFFALRTLHELVLGIALRQEMVCEYRNLDHLQELCCPFREWYISNAEGKFNSWTLHMTQSKVKCYIYFAPFPHEYAQRRIQIRICRKPKFAQENNGMHLRMLSGPSPSYVAMPTGRWPPEMRGVLTWAQWSQRLSIGQLFQ